MLLADGSAQPQLKFHMAGFLNAGGEPKALIELMFISVALLGFPPTVNAIGLIRAVFAERKLAFEPIEPSAGDGSTRRQAGLETLDRLSGGDVQAYFDGFAAGSPDLAQLSIEFTFGEMLARDGLDQKAKLFAIISMLAATTEIPLRVHINAALNVGATREEILEALVNLTPYSGYPAIQQAVRIAAEEFSKRG